MAHSTDFFELKQLQSALELHTVDQLKALLALLPCKSRSIRKADLIEAIEQHLQGETLITLWHELDSTQQNAVAEALYSDTGTFNLSRFKAKYNKSPKFDQDNNDRYQYIPKPSQLRLFLFSGQRYGAGLLYIPADLAQRLLSFVPRPTKTALSSQSELPPHFQRIDTDYIWQEDDPGLTIISNGGSYRIPKKKPTIKTHTQEIDIIQYNTEQNALAEISIMLRLVDQGKLSVSEKTYLPSAATLRNIGATLAAGDFYPANAKHPEYQDEIGPIKALAWPLLLQAGGLAELQNKKLALTKTGYSALHKPAEETISRLWQRWQKNKRFDEFNRINAIKGQQGKGKRTMTATSGRREIIVNALAHCPIGEWVNFKDFNNYMQAVGYDFEVNRNPWHLYISDSNYGALGYNGAHNWNILQQRYIAVLLFEYAATLGLIDIGYVEPWQVPRDFADLWGTDDLSFLSRYDGLLWFRLNPLGAYCLNLKPDYQAPSPEIGVALMVMPSQQIKVLSGDLSTEESLFLDMWADQEDPMLWRLSRSKILTMLENGRPISELSDFLEKRDEQGLPETIAGFLSLIERQANALKNTGAVLLIECADKDLLKLITTHQLTQSLCQKLGANHIAIKTGDEERFRKAIKKLGYGMPKI